MAINGALEYIINHIGQEGYILYRLVCVNRHKKYSNERFGKNRGITL